jgi:hypothetical protein
MKKMFNCILLFGLLILIYHILQKYKINNNNNNNNNNDNCENFDMSKIYYNPPIEKDIKFDYDFKEIDNKFLKEQDNGFNVAHYVSNNATPFDQVVNTSSKTLYNYDFNKLRISNSDLDNGNGKTIKEIYEDSFVNFKKLIPKKNMIKSNEDTLLEGGSNISFFTNDTWVYDNEKPENGGSINKGLYATDMEKANAIFSY